MSEDANDALSLLDAVFPIQEMLHWIQCSKWYIKNHILVKNFGIATRYVDSVSANMGMESGLTKIVQQMLCEYEKSYQVGNPTRETFRKFLVADNLFRVENSTKARPVTSCFFKLRSSNAEYFS